jgi:hypothetical protein
MDEFGGGEFDRDRTAAGNVVDHSVDLDASNRW